MTTTDDDKLSRRDKEEEIEPVSESSLTTEERDDSRDGTGTDEKNEEGNGFASRVLSRISTKSSVAPPPPPDGGFTAWMVVFAGHLVVMSTWGVINSFGAFQSYYTTTLARPASSISWIGSIQIFLLFFIGTFTGRLTDAGFFRPCMFLGIALVTIGVFTAAECTAYWQLFLSQGICVGLGNGFLFCPAVAVLSTYWKKRRSLAIGIAACGSATGGLVFPSMVRELLPKIGFEWTMRAIGFIIVACLVVSMVFLKTRVPPRPSGQLIDLDAFKELEYTFYAIGAFMCFWGLYFPFFYLATYARDIQDMSGANSLNLLLIMNGIGIFGRVGFNMLADTFGPVNLFIPMAACCSILMYAWAGVANIAGLYGWACVYGICAGGIQSLFPAAVSSLTDDLRKMGTRMGMVFTIVSFAVLTGPPVAGALISAMGGGYLGAQMFAGSVLGLGAVSVALSREVKRRKLGKAFFSNV